MRLDDLVFVGTFGHVRALRRSSGRAVWTTSLPGTGYSIVTLMLEGDVLIAGTCGYLFALDPMSGEIRWKNGLKGLGLGHMTMVSARNPSSGAVAALDAQAQSDAAAASS